MLPDTLDTTKNTVILRPLNPDKTLVVIVGPTAVGKTELAFNLAKELRCQIISADSRQIYKELNIGTCKPSPYQLSKVEHHFINNKTVDDRFTAYDYFMACRSLFPVIFSQNRMAILTGGSGLFVDAATTGLDEIPDVQAAVREELSKKFNTAGLETLYTRLVKLDPVYAAIVDRHNPRRVIRALEVCIGTGKPYSSFRGAYRHKLEYNMCKIGLELPRPELNKRIDKRVDKMMLDGLADEVYGLLSRKESPALNTIGYREIFDHLEQGTGLELAVSKIKRNTRMYAKRQMTWFKKDQTIKWFNPSETEAIRAYVDNAINS